MKSDTRNWISFDELKEGQVFRYFNSKTSKRFKVTSIFVKDDYSKIIHYRDLETFQFFKSPNKKTRVILFEE